MRWIALDIGGANVKVADGEDYAVTQPFAIWKTPQALPQFLRRLIAESPHADRLAVTMTGELADCFESKADGIVAILRSVNEAADGRHTRIYLSDGRLVTPQVAERTPELVAAANWHALATYAARFAPTDSSLLLDIGSTTTDIVPISDGRPAAQGTTDTQRLIHGELYYSGVLRNPVCGIARTGIYRQCNVPLAQEFFATSADVYRLLGDLPEVPTDTETADGRPATKRYARARLARMVCADSTEFNHRDAVTLAQSIADAQAAQIRLRVEQVIAELSKPLTSIILSGIGEFVGHRIANGLFPCEPATKPVDQSESLQTPTSETPPSPIVSLMRELDVARSVAAPAHALAVLAREATTQ